MKEFIPDTNRWYSYRVSAWNENGQVMLGCSIWPEEENEPDRMRVWG
ncbi:MAG: hypothetical protein JRC67_10120, partial [Deltaproteobacteria bacterium]|nr:hypothetical protein [Deltaproteobacteria bacterium]